MLILPLVVTIRDVVAVVACTAVVVVGYKASGVIASVVMPVGVGGGESGVVSNCIAIGVSVLAQSLHALLSQGL